MLTSELDELIKKEFYSSSRDWNKLFWPTEFFFFIFCFALSSFPWLGSLDDGPSDLPMEGWLSHSWAYQTYVWYSPCGGVSCSWRVLALLAICLRKSALQDGVLENHQGSGELFPVRLTASTVRGFRQSSFHFSERTFTSSPIRMQAVSPVRRNPRDPWGSGWPRLGPSRGESGPWANPMKNFRIASHVINFDIEIHVG